VYGIPRGSSHKRTEQETEHPGSLVETVVKTQSLFRRYFNISRNGSVPTRNAIKLWVQNFRETGLDKKSPGKTATVRTPDNTENVKSSILLVIYFTLNTRIFNFKFLYLWRYVLVLIYHLQAIFQMSANN
jgi:hypothetical protein